MNINLIFGQFIHQSNKINENWKKIVFGFGSGFGFWIKSLITALAI
jgi:hypothetical protein